MIRETGCDSNYGEDVAWHRTDGVTEDRTGPVSPLIPSPVYASTIKGFETSLRFAARAARKLPTDMAQSEPPGWRVRALVSALDLE